MKKRKKIYEGKKGKYIVKAIDQTLKKASTKGKRQKS